MTVLRWLIAVVAALTLAACAGTPFKRPDAGTVVPGRTTGAEVQALMGAPLQTGEVLKNGETLRVLRYAYAEAGGTGRYPGVTPGRAQVFTLWRDQVVGQEFVSSFQGDATDFDDSRVSTIVKGRTTRREVEALLGKPNGEAIYPVISRRGETGMLYSYSHVTGAPLRLRAYQKVLLVAVDAAGLVTEVEFTSSGER